ncbi:hypothetical protein DSECCO2_110810 [anaerobic digester metagenome]
MKVDPNKFDYVMYVDASGDDGFKFENDSTSCYAAAALLVEKGDIAHNLEVLNQIKKLVGCKPTDEVKYSKVRRHRNGPEALSLLKTINGKLSCFVVFKKEVDRAEYEGTKEMSVICHYMALQSLNSYSFLKGKSTLIAIDRMKNTEEQPLGEALAEDNKNPTREFTSETVFRDSKDSNFLLIQIADLLCGTVREHFEQYETNSNMLYFKDKCPICAKLMQIKKSRTHPLCHSGKSRASEIYKSKNFHNILQLFPTIGGARMLDYIFMEPTKMVDQHFYLFCPRKK